MAENSNLSELEELKRILKIEDSTSTDNGRHYAAHSPVQSSTHRKETEKNKPELFQPGKSRFEKPFTQEEGNFIANSNQRSHHIFSSQHAQTGFNDRVGSYVQNEGNIPTRYFRKKEKNWKTKLHERQEPHQRDSHEITRQQVPICGGSVNTIPRSTDKDFQKQTYHTFDLNDKRVHTKTNTQTSVPIQTGSNSLLTNPIGHGNETKRIPASASVKHNKETTFSANKECSIANLPKDKLENSMQKMTSQKNAYGRSRQQKQVSATKEEIKSVEKINESKYRSEVDHKDNRRELPKTSCDGPSTKISAQTVVGAVIQHSIVKETGKEEPVEVAVNSCMQMDGGAMHVEEKVTSLPLENVEEAGDVVRLVLWPPRSNSKKEKGDSKSSSPVENEGNLTKENSPLIVVLKKNELDYLIERHIFPLKNISSKYPRAIFYCRFCNMHTSTVKEGHKHAESARHRHLLDLECQRRTASLVPDFPPHMLKAIEETVEEVYRQNSLSPADLKNRQIATEKLKYFIETNFLGTLVQIYGSTYTGLGLKSSDVNVGVAVRNEELSPGLIMLSIFQFLKQNPVWGDIREEFNSRLPVIHFLDVQYQVRFSLVMDNENAFKTSVLLHQYHMIDNRFAILTVAFRIVVRLCKLDQPELGTLPPHAYTLMVLYYLQQKKVLPVLHELKESDEADAYLSAPRFMELKNEYQLKNYSLGELWLGLVKFYAHQFPYNEITISVRSLQQVTRASMNWGNRRIAIEDPFHHTVNMGSALKANLTFDYFLNCFRNVNRYFWTPQTLNGPLFGHLLSPKDIRHNNSLFITPAEASKRMAQLTSSDVKWNFSSESFLLDLKIPIVCNVCSRNGHTNSTCPELQVPPVGPIPPPDFGYFQVLDNICWSVLRQFAQRDIDIRNREVIRQELESHIRTVYSDAKLAIFGSSCNGFGFSDSDVDLCLTLESNPDGKNLNLAAIVKKLAKLLYRNRSFCNVLPIPSAKVPIVKLRHRSTGLESDISLYNRLGQRNSHLLYTYARIDPRVRALGYMTKILAKQCEVGDASRGSLSSYAYTLMVIHYLQQVKPPVLPVLQEIVIPGLDKSHYLIEGWDTWFFDDLPNLPRFWSHYGTNQEPPSTLWLGFLLYYAEIFDYRQQVVCIRQLRPLYRLEKMWSDKPIAIEDPFDLNHNLGSGVSYRMGAFIRRMFVNSRRVFQTPVKQLPRKFRSLEEYLFNPEILIPEGPPPNDRGCLVCGKIGHKAKDCEVGKTRKGKTKPPVKAGREIVAQNGMKEKKQSTVTNKRQYSPKLERTGERHIQDSSQSQNGSDGND